MKCQVCFKEIPDNIDYCPTCNMNVQESVPQQRKKICINCRNEQLPQNKFCSNCGQTVGNIPLESNYDLPHKMFKAPKSELKSTLFKGIIVAIGICVLIELFLILTGDFSGLHVQVILSIIAIIFYGIIASNSVDLYEKTKYKAIGANAMVVIGLGFIHTTLYIWEIINFTNFDPAYKLLFSQWLIVIGLAHTIYLLLINVKTKLAKRVLMITTPLIFITYTAILFWVDFDIDNEFYERLILVSVILTLFGTVATVILNKIKEN